MTQYIDASRNARTLFLKSLFNELCQNASKITSLTIKTGLGLKEHDLWEMETLVHRISLITPMKKVEFG